MPDKVSNSDVPEDYKPLSPDERGQWNGFLSNLQSKGVDPKDLDSNPELGFAHMAAYADKNPGFELTYSQIPHIQYDHQQLRTGDTFGGLTPDQTDQLRGKLHPAFQSQALPEVNGNIDSKTANLFYPEVNVTDSKGRQLDNHGTDVESYAKKYLTAPVGKDTPESDASQGAAPTNKDDKDADEWFKSYVSSPKYQERLGNFYQHPDLVQQVRERELGQTGFTESKYGKTFYDPSNNLNVSTQQLKELGAGRGEAVVHELGHAVNASDDNKALRLSSDEERFILNREAILSDKQKELFGQQAEDTTKGSTISKSLSSDPGSHDAAPSENLSDIQSLRYLMNKKGIYDARTQDLTPELLQKAKADPDIQKAFTAKRLFDRFKDPDLLEIMNKVAIGGHQPKFDENVS